jgi:hypothetical protein
MRLLRLAILVAAVGCSSTDEDDTPPIGDAPIGLNDVSVMFPLAQIQASPLRLDTLGAGGPLLDPAVFAMIPNGDPVAFPARPYERWVVVAARIDPCFPNLALLTSDPSKCRRQLRLVAQPLDGADIFDHAIHLLYDLSEHDFKVMSHRWLALRTASTADPAVAVDAHPVLVAEGGHGPFGTAIRQLIQDFAGTATLTQIAFTMAGGDPANGVFSKQFGAFRRSGDTWAAVPIASAEPATLQVLTTRAAAPSVVPSTATTDLILPLLADEMVPTDGTAPDRMRRAIDVTDPRLADSDSDHVDCVSCHISGQAVALVDHRVPMPDLVRVSIPPYNLMQTGFGDSEPLVDMRAFGYLDAPSWNQRAIYESALVAATLSQPGLWW